MASTQAISRRFVLAVLVASIVTIGAVLAAGRAAGNAAPSNPPDPSEQSSALTRADAVALSDRSATLNTAKDVEALRGRLEQTIPVWSGTDHTLATMGWENAVGASEATVVFVAQFRASCSWWQGALRGDLTARAIVHDLPAWSALRNGPQFEGRDLVKTISDGVLAEAGSSELVEATRLYTVNCVDPRAH